MGASFCVVCRAEKSEKVTVGADHDALLKAQTKLDRLARANKLRSLDEFTSTSDADVADLLEEIGLDPEEAGREPEQWFAPADGLAAVRALADHLRAKPTAVAKSADILADLERVEKELAAAAKKKQLFHFSVVA